MKIIPQLLAGEKILHRGDLKVEGNVGAGAQIVVVDGSLFIVGTIDAGSRISVFISEELMSVGADRFRFIDIPLNRQKLTASNYEGFNTGLPLYARKDLSKEPKKVSIRGIISDNVIIYSDAEITANDIGKNCFIISEYEGITARNIDQETVIAVRDAITITGDIKDYCKITSHDYGITGQNVGMGTTISVHDAISLQDIGFKCIIHSYYDGLNAKKLDKDVTIHVSEAITLTDVGDNAKINSKYGTVSICNIGVNATITADNIYIMGTCPNPDSLKLYCNGLVDAPQLPQVKVHTNLLATGSSENAIPLAMELSKTGRKAVSSEIGLFKSPRISPGEEPMIFKLEGYSPEKKEIINWISKHRSSPKTRVEMEPCHAIDEKMLKRSRYLTNAIAEFRQEKLELFEENRLMI